MDDINKIENIFDLNSPDLYFNRELSFLEFNRRVLSEAEDLTHPLLERLKFITIISSNLDEFFMIRVAGLKSQVIAGVVELSMDGMTPQEQMSEIREQILPIYENQSRILNEDVLPALEKENIIIHFYEELSKPEKKELKNYFCESVLPVLTPLSLDPAHPFPRIINRSLNIAFVLNDKSKKAIDTKVAFLQLPSFLQRLVRIDRPDGYHYVLMESIVKANAEILFPGLTVEASHTFRVTRDADIEIAEDEAEDLLREIAEQVRHRKWETAAVRLEVSANMPDYLLELLRKSLELEPSDVYILNRPLNLGDFMQLTKIDVRNLKDKPFQSNIVPEFENDGPRLFEAIRKRDFIVHHPYDSFSNSVLKYISQSADCPDVLAIKITLYRTGMNSPVVEALKRAAENGKDVTAFVELKARFDEENNITWAKELEHVGVHVVYGVLGLKTHCKIALVIRRENNKLRKYMHLATGNYNHTTSRLYSDIGFFTANEEFGMDAIHLFNYLTGYSYQKEWNNFIVAPIFLRKRLLDLIEREIELHTPENPGLIFCKMNAIAHGEVSQALYRASQKGVKIRLLVRGICCLKPGIPGISENIEVRSIIGRFLEHSRIFYFHNGGDRELYLSSADWMTRNLHNRVELMFPIKEKSIQKQLIEILDIYWKDNIKSWILQSDGFYKKVEIQNGENEFSAQDYFLSEIRKSKKKSRSKSVGYMKRQ